MVDSNVLQLIDHFSIEKIGLDSSHIFVFCGYLNLIEWLKLMYVFSPSYKHIR